MDPQFQTSICTNVSGDFLPPTLPRWIVATSLPAILADLAHADATTRFHIDMDLDAAAVLDTGRDIATHHLRTPAATDCQRRAQVENLVGAQRYGTISRLQLYGRSIGKRASFALKFGFIAEKFAQA